MDTTDGNGLRISGAARLAAVLLVLLPLGCAPARVRMSPDEVRAEFGRIGITTSESPTTTSFDRPMTHADQAAKVGAAVGFVGAIDGGLRTGNPLGMGLGLAVSPFTAIGGAIYGALAARSPEKVEQAALDLERAIAESNVHEKLRDLVVARLAEVDRYPDVRAYDGASHTGADEPETVIEVSVANVSLVGRGINPTLKLYLQAPVRARKGTVATGHWTAVAGGDGETFLTWAGGNSQRFRQQIDRELQRLAEKIAADVFSRTARESDAVAPAPRTVDCRTVAPTSTLAQRFCH